MNPHLNALDPNIYSDEIAHTHTHTSYYFIRIHELRLTKESLLPLMHICNLPVKQFSTHCVTHYQTNPDWKKTSLAEVIKQALNHSMYRRWLLGTYTVICIHGAFSHVIFASSPDWRENQKDSNHSPGHCSRLSRMYVHRAGAGEHWPDGVTRFIRRK